MKARKLSALEVKWFTMRICLAEPEPNSFKLSNTFQIIDSVLIWKHVVPLDFKLADNIRDCAEEGILQWARTEFKL